MDCLSTRAFCEDYKKSPATFPLATDVLPVSIKWWDTFVYNKAILILLRTPGDHLKHVREVLHLSMKIEFIFKLKNLYFYSKVTVYLGRVICTE